MPMTDSKITKTPNVCGGDARIDGTRIPVWVLVNCRRQGASPADVLQAYPSLKAADLEAAWTYATLHQDEIDQAIRENEAGEAGLVE
jgi:uncharacterized protein (DUF433 family)